MSNPSLLKLCLLYPFMNQQPRDNQPVGMTSLVMPSPSEPSQDLMQILKKINGNFPPSKLVAAFEVSEFQVGDELFSLAATDPEAVETLTAINGTCYLIHQGRVRLLGFDPERQRETCAMVLEVGDSFGGDHLWRSQPLSYRAVAATAGIYAHIPQAELTSQLREIPRFQAYLQEQTAQRQSQLFLKTLTELRSLSSHQIRQLLPYLQEKHIPAGSSLAQVTPTQEGHYWLRTGQIQGYSDASNHSSPVQIQGMGTSWGYPQETPPDWIAHTDIEVLTLPRVHWESASTIAPQLAGDRQKNGHQKVPLSLTSHAVIPQSNSPSPNHHPPSSRPPNHTAIFPKPIGRRVLDTLAQYPHLQQQSTSDCGAACLVMIGKYWGKRFSLNLVREMANVGRSGTSLKSLAKAAETLGFHARPVRASLSGLADQKNPWIAHWEGIHYVVIYKVQGQRILVSDPAEGKRWLPKSEFLNSWTGYALLLDPTERLENATSRERNLGSFFQVLWPYRTLAVQIILASILIQIFGIVSPLFTQIIIDQVVVNKSVNALTVFSLGALIFGLGSMAIGATRAYLLDYFSNRIDLTLISGFISHTLQLPLKFFESRRVGDIITRVQENQKIQRFLIGQVVLAWLNFLTGFVYLGLMLYYNARLTVLVLALIPPIAILTLVATPFMRRVSREVFNASAEQNSSLVEMMTGISTVKTSAAERELRWRWEDRLVTSLNARFRAQKLGLILQTTGGVIDSLGNIALLWYGSLLVIQGDLTIGQLMAFNMMIGRVISPVLALVNLWDELQEVWISVERLNDVLSTEPEEPAGSQMLVLPKLQGYMRLENVTFRYSEDMERNVLENICLEVQPGQTIAIVGRSGSGKSTLVNLLQGLYYPTSGRIWIDGHDICRVSPHSLRSQMGVVPQECFLFSGTIAENITLFNEDISLDTVVDVAKLAEAHGFIQEMAGGYNTKVGERGSSLSGGQRQRIAIARALLGNPQILILDEATSSLDTESERRFQQNLEQIRRDRTTFIIAHRLSTVRNADCILVLDRGLLVESGNHDQLMKQQGLYYHLAQQQLDL